MLPFRGKRRRGELKSMALVVEATMFRRPVGGAPASLYARPPARRPFPGSPSHRRDRPCVCDAHQSDEPLEL